LAASNWLLQWLLVEINTTTLAAVWQASTNRGESIRKKFGKRQYWANPVP
jgi:hypothetical protein